VRSAAAGQQNGAACCLILFGMGSLTQSANKIATKRHKTAQKEDELQLSTGSQRSAGGGSFKSTFVAFSAFLWPSFSV
jgi:hypothetical protein